jgi:hypothetical protein
MYGVAESNGSHVATFARDTRRFHRFPLDSADRRLRVSYTITACVAPQKTALTWSGKRLHSDKTWRVALKRAYMEECKPSQAGSARVDHSAKSPYTLVEAWYFGTGRHGTTCDSCASWVDNPAHCSTRCSVLHVDVNLAG